MPKIKSQNKWRTSQVTEHITRRQKRCQTTKAKMYEMNIIIDQNIINTHHRKCQCEEKMVDFPGYCAKCFTVFEKLKVYSSQPGRTIEVTIL